MHFASCKQISYLNVDIQHGTIKHSNLSHRVSSPNPAQVGGLILGRWSVFLFHSHLFLFGHSSLNLQRKKKKPLVPYFIVSFARPLADSH